MKKLINKPESVVAEMIEGLAAAFPGMEQIPGQMVIVRAELPEPSARPVAVISGGGSGHEPAHTGYVGAGTLCKWQAFAHAVAKKALARAGYLAEDVFV